MIRQTRARTPDIAGLEVGLDGRPLRLDRPVDEWDHRRGPLDAAAQVVEYGDYQCPFCAEALPGVKEMLSLFGDRLLFAFRHFPLVSQHPNAWPAALATEAAGRQERFWEMHDHLLSHRHSLSDEELLSHARALGLDMTRFQRDFRDPEVANKIRQDAISGLHSGVTGTPTFFVDGRRLEGGYQSQELRAAMESALKARPPKRSPS
jgi:protein-disulfide isomerase